MIRRPPWGLLAVALTVVAACGGSTISVGSHASASPPATGTPIASPSRTATPAPSLDLPALLERARQAQDAPGAIAVLEVRGTRTFLTAGAADMAGGDLTETTRFRIASITKPVIAALVLGAVARREVELGDTVGDLVPGVVRATPAITVRQLLDHTSGVFDEGNEGDPVADIERLADPAVRDEARSLFARFQAGEDIITPDHVIVALAETHDRYFAPGAGYHYSNVNYQLAGMVLEKVTGQPLAELLRSRIVQPLGLRHTTIAPPDMGSPEMRGYVIKAGEADPIDLTDDLSFFGNGGNGGIISTPDELLAILRAIVTAELFPDPLVDEMVTPNRESYGLGVANYGFSCGTFHGHNGLVNGTHSTAVVTRDGSDGAVIALNLMSTRDPGLHHLAERMLCAGR
jgi:D-alanyl-D-alanine carboxypeptidase